MGLKNRRTLVNNFCIYTVPDNTNTMSSNDLEKYVCVIKHPLSQQSFTTETYE